MKKPGLILGWLLLITFALLLSLWAANPSFTSFDTSQFVVNGTNGLSLAASPQITNNMSIGTMTVSNASGPANLTLIGSIVTAEVKTGPAYLAIGPVGNEMIIDINGGTSITGTASANTFSGSGSLLNNLNASVLASGTVPTGVLGSGSATSTTILHGNNTWSKISLANDVTGTLADGSLSANVDLLNGTQTITGAKVMNNAANSFTGSGAGLTSLNAGNLASGTAPTARLGSGSATSTTILHGNNTWGQIVLTTDVTGILPVANGGGGGNTAGNSATNIGIYALPFDTQTNGAFTGNYNRQLGITPNGLVYLSDGSGNWSNNATPGSGLQFAMGMGEIGSSSNMAPGVNQVIIDSQGSPTGWATAGDPQLLARSWSPHVQNSGSGIVAAIMGGPDAAGKATYLSGSAGIAMVQAPSNRITALVPGTAYQVFNFDAINTKGFGWCSPGFPNGVNDQNNGFGLYMDVITGTMRSPLANANQAGVQQPADVVYDFAVTGVTVSPPNFDVSVYVNNGHQYSAYTNNISGGTGHLMMTCCYGPPLAVGTLTKINGIGDATISYTVPVVFTVASITTSPTAGATYTHNGFTYTVVSTALTGNAPTISGTITATPTGVPLTSGTLTKSGGTGDATIAFSSFAIAQLRTWSDSLTWNPKTGSLTINSNFTAANFSTANGVVTAKRYAVTQGNVPASSQVGLDLGLNGSGLNYEVVTPGGIAGISTAVTATYVAFGTTPAQGWNNISSWDVGSDVNNGNLIGDAVIKAHGSLGSDVKTKSASYTLTAADSLILVNASGVQTMTLPICTNVLSAADHVDGRMYAVKNLATTNVTLAAAANSTIEGVSSLTVFQGQYAQLQADTNSSSFKIVGGNAGPGVGNVVGEAILTGQSGSLGTTTLFTVPTTGGYEVSGALIDTTSGAAGTVTGSVTWTDEAGSASTSMGTQTLTGTGRTTFGPVFMSVTSGNAIQYSTTVAGAVGGPLYALKISVKRVQ